MVRSGLLSFKDMGPNVQQNPLPKHGNRNVVNVIAEDNRVLEVNLIIGGLVKMHVPLCKVGYCSHDQVACNVCSGDTRGYDEIRSDLPDIMDRNHIKTIRLRDDPENEINVVYGPPREIQIRDVNETNVDLVKLHATFLWEVRKCTIMVVA